MMHFLETTGAQVAFYIALSFAIGLIGIIVKWAKAHFKLADTSLAAQVLDYTVASLTQVANAKIQEGMSQSDAVAHALSLISPGTKTAMAIRQSTPEIIGQRIVGNLAFASAASASTITNNIALK